MKLFRSYRAKLQASFFLLALLAIAVTHWQASTGAVAALRQTTYDRLTAIAETKRRAVQDYFSSVSNQVLALSTDESSITALEQFQSAWNSLPGLEPGDIHYEDLRRHYRDAVTPSVTHAIPEPKFMEDWFPNDSRARALQRLFISDNPYPNGSKDHLLEPRNGGVYGRVHGRYHPTLHRYQTAFGFYDIFLIDAREGRILYTVMKEIDLGAKLTSPPYQKTTLARAFQRALSQENREKAIIEDYAPYVPSNLAPAAFLAAPIWRAGAKIGVLAIQVSIEHVNRVMTGDHHWEGMGRSGHAYIVGADHTLRSDVRFELEDAEAFFSQLRGAGVIGETIEQIRRNRTAILTLSLDKGVADRIRDRPGTEIGRDFRNVPVLRSHLPLNLPGLDWVLVAEMETEEAFAPISALRKRLWGTGLLIAAAFVVAAWFLGRSVTRPVMALAEGTRRLGGGDFGVRLQVPSSDEIGQLSSSFNRMAEQLERTTVSRDRLDQANQELSLKKRELENLNARLISAQEEERSRLARELHDDLSQRLAAAAIQAGTLKRIPEANTDKWREGLAAIQHSLAQISDDVHGLSRRLHSSVLDELGLVAAIEGECRGFFERGGPPVEFSHSGTFGSVSKDAQLALYRIVQEALRNIVRHAEASEVKIHLQADEESIVLDIEDNGRGFDQQSPTWKRGLGLASLNERARLFGGTVTIHSAPGAGTRISTGLPVNEVHDQTSNNSRG